MDRLVGVIASFGPCAVVVSWFVPLLTAPRRFEHPQNVSLQRVLNSCVELRSIRAATDQELANVVNPEQVRYLCCACKGVWLKA